MTMLSVNLNKLALLRNSRGRNFPDLLKFARRFIELGVKGLTVHPRPDERHVTRNDVVELTALLKDFPAVEFNVEGFPSDRFLQLVEATRPTQCTLVPDADSQLTSDHGWNCRQSAQFLLPVLQHVKALGVRTALFLDPDVEQIDHAKQLGTDRIELYTEHYARAFPTHEKTAVLLQYRTAALHAQELGLGVNAGHDLDLQNLPLFLTIPGIEEVSIGHALTVECIEQGLVEVIAQYLRICQKH